MKQPPGRQPVDPTPEQIRQACQRIQAKWSSVERRKRTVQRTDPVSFGSVATDERHRWTEVV